MRPYALGAVALLLFLGLSPGLPAASQTQTPPSAPTVPPTPPPTTTPEQPAPAAEPAPACSDCHELAASFTHNPHARGQLENGAVPNGVCETCHAGASEHAQTGDPTQVTIPRGRKGTDETCRMCHDRADGRRSHRAGMHANSEHVNCLSCHSIHHSAPAQTYLLRAPEPQLCASCHATQVAEFRNKPYAHRIGRGGFGCTSCHEPHGRPGEESIRRTNMGEQACIACHSNVRGPFVFPHGASAFTNNPGVGSNGQCQSCHQPHGSNNPKMLKRATVAQLCIECHSNLGEPTLGSQPPSFHNLNLPRYQNCTTCHVAVHGSNRSPALLK